MRSAVVNGFSIFIMKLTDRGSTYTVQIIPKKVNVPKIARSTMATRKSSGTSNGFRPMNLSSMDEAIKLKHDRAKPNSTMSILSEF